MMTVFILMTGEWTDAMMPASAVFGPSVAFYFIPVALIGVFLLLNLFIGVLLNAFAEDEEASAEPEMASPAEPEGAPSAEGADEDDPSWAKDGDEVVWPRDYSLCLFCRSHPLRRACRAVVRSSLFDFIVMSAILISSVRI